MIKKLALISSFLLILSAIQSTVLAQQKNGSGFKVSPVRQEMSIEKGGSESVKIYVENLSNSATTAQVLINDFDPADDESGQPMIRFNGQPTTTGNSFKSIASSVDKIVLGPLKKGEITVKLTVPKNSPAGGYYGVVRFADVNDPQKSNVALAASVGTLFLVTVPGNITENMSLVDLTAAKNSSPGRLFINSGPMSVIVRLRNTGNIHVKPFGKVEVRKGSKVVESYDINNTQPRANVLPNSTRKFEDKLKNEYGFGKYTVVANLGYGSSGSLINGKTTFWIIPSWMLIIGVIVLAAIFIIGYLIYRKITNNKRRHKSHHVRR